MYTFLANHLPSFSSFSLSGTSLFSSTSSSSCRQLSISRRICKQPHALGKQRNSFSVKATLHIYKHGSRFPSSHPSRSNACRHYIRLLVNALFSRGKNIMAWIRLYFLSRLKNNIALILGAILVTFSIFLFGIFQVQNVNYENVARQQPIMVNVKQDSTSKDHGLRCTNHSTSLFLEQTHHPSFPHHRYNSYATVFPYTPTAVTPSFQLIADSSVSLENFTKMVNNLSSTLTGNQVAQEDKKMNLYSTLAACTSFMVLWWAWVQKGKHKATKISLETSSGITDADQVISFYRGTRVMFLQLAFEGKAKESLQDYFRNLASGESSTAVDTSTQDGLATALRQAANTVKAKQFAWIGARSWASFFKNTRDAEVFFTKVSIQERSKWKNDSISNVNGVIKASGYSWNLSMDGTPKHGYLVTTFIAALKSSESPADDTFLEPKMTIEALCNCTADNLLGVEILWCPEYENETLTEAEVKLKYPDLLV